MPVAYGISFSCELLSHLQPHLVGLRVVIGVGVQVEADDLKPAFPIKGNGPLVAGLVSSTAIRMGAASSSIFSIRAVATPQRRCFS